MAQTVEALIYSRRNNTGSIPDRNKIVYFILGNSMLSILSVPTQITICFSLVLKTMGNAVLSAWCNNCGSKIRVRESSISLFCRKHKTEFTLIFALGTGCEVWIFLKNK